MNPQVVHNAESTVGAWTTSTRIGVDIGGTFTDAVLVDARGHATLGKVLTTPEDPAIGFVEAVRLVLRRSDIEARTVREIIHGTTLAANAIIERKGALTGLITTKGFRDSLEIGRERRHDMDDLFQDRPRPLVPRYLRTEVRERVLSDGTVLQPLLLEDVDAAVELFVNTGVKAVAVCLLHAHRNAKHELTIYDRLKSSLTGAAISISSDIHPEIREYERASTTVANAYVMPLVSHYLGEVEQRLSELGITCRLMLMTSAGGTCTVETARHVPIRLLESGPAGGVTMAARWGQAIGEKDLLSFDMGGTTAKLCVITDGIPATTTDFEVARVDRFKRGSGLPIRGRVVELIEIGAGGGSIAWIDRLGLLKVGPQSAGAAPGPACYGGGGNLPTVTDADVVLGYINPDYFLGGKMSLDRQAAEGAIRPIARSLGLSLVEAAWGIHQVANEAMASAARVHMAERGKDPSRHVVFAFGGAGPVHAFHVAELLRSTRVVVPAAAGVGSALGFLVAPLTFDYVRSFRSLMSQMDWIHANRLLDEMEDEGRSLLMRAGVSSGEVMIARSADMRYVGQSHELEVPVVSGRLNADAIATVLAAFKEIYQQHFRHVYSGADVEILNWRVKASAPTPPFKIEQIGKAPGAAEEPLKGERLVYHREFKEFRPVRVYDRYMLRAGDLLEGPAIIEEHESTTIVGPKAMVNIDNFGNLLVHW